MADFISEYFVNPILYQNDYAPYNVYNTAAYAIIALAAIYLIFNALKHFKVSVDEDFARAVLPFVVFGAALRVLEDGHFLPRVVNVFGFQAYPFVTPGIYVLTFILLGVSAVASILIAGRGNAKKLLSKIGIAFAGITLLTVAVQLKFFAHALAIIVLAFVFLKAFGFVYSKLGNRLSSLEAMAFYGQALDGCATFISVQFGSPAAKYFEQHVVGGSLIAAFGPIAFLLVKLAFAAAVVYFLRKEKEEEKNYVLILITVFGLGPGMRDLLRLAAGV